MSVANLSVDAASPAATQAGAVPAEAPPTTAAAPATSSRPSSPAAFSSAGFNADVEAVATDPAALWAALDLPAPESLPSQHSARRVVLLGRPLSGKRTLCRRLCFAAEAQYTATDGDAGDARGGGATADNGRQPLYRPSSSDDEDAVLFPGQKVGGWNLPGAFSSVGALQERTAVGPHTHAEAMTHGSGVSFDYVVQRVPTRVARGGGGGEGRETATATTAAAAARRGPSTPAATPAQAGGTVRRTTEFFCCDSAGALSMALPTLDDLQTAVVLMVVDLSDVATLHQQLDFCYTTLNTYVASVLRAQAPTNDEVRRLQLASAQQDYWFAEEQKLRATRESLANGTGPTPAIPASSASPREVKSDVVFKDPTANLDKVNATPFRVPASANTVCPMRTVLVCTKAEVLERASRAIGVLDGSSSSGNDNDALFAAVGVSPALAAAMRRSRLSLMALVSQLLRQYAIYHRAAVASLGQRVNMTTAGADGEYAGSALVNPFYKGFWAYLSYLLYESGSADVNSMPSSDVLRVCSARMHPHALLPCGLDAPGLLNPFITSEQVQMSDICNNPAEEPADGAIRTTVESVLTPDGVFALHQKYLQLAQQDTSTTWGQVEATTLQVEEPEMVWDSL